LKGVDLNYVEFELGPKVLRTHGHEPYRSVENGMANEERIFYNTREWTTKMGGVGGMRV
jgi:hypothetical protein